MEEKDRIKRREDGRANSRDFDVIDFIIKRRDITRLVLTGSHILR